MITYQPEEAAAILATWAKYAPAEAQVALDAGIERGEKWALDQPIHHDLTSTYWRAQAGLKQQALTITNHAALKWAFDNVWRTTPPGGKGWRRLGDNGTFQSLLGDILTWVAADPEPTHQGWFGPSRLNPGGRALPRESATNGPRSMTERNLVNRLRYHRANNTPVSESPEAWWQILHGAEVAITARWATCWPHVWAAFTSPRYSPAEGRQERALDLIDAVGKAAAENLRPPPSYATWEDVSAGRRRSPGWSAGIHTLSSDHPLRDTPGFENASTVLIKHGSHPASPPETPR